MCWYNLPLLIKIYSVNRFTCIQIYKPIHSTFLYMFWQCVVKKHIAILFLLYIFACCKYDGRLEGVLLLLFCCVHLTAIYYYYSVCPLFMKTNHKDKMSLHIILTLN